jgi:Cu(I)/Ag(I) efflux system membrane fusion protein
MRYLLAITLAAFVSAGCKHQKAAAIVPEVAMTMDEITLSEQQMQLGNISVDTIHAAGIGNQLLLNATLNFDQQKTSSVSSRVAGRVQKLYFKNIGDYIEKGAKLYELYSEQLNNAKQEYLLALEKQKTLDNTLVDFTRLVQAAKNKLLLWGMSEGQINELATAKSAPSLTAYYSPSAGYITTLDIKEGDYVEEGGMIVRLADLSVLWAEAQLYASQLSGIDIKSSAEVRFPDLPGVMAQGRIDFMNPEINAGSRINLIRVGVPNTGHRLRPGMQATVTIKSPSVNMLSLPAEAVIRDSHGASVWVQTGPRRFHYKTVVTGAENNDRIEIKSGLAPGEQVVTSGAYLLNSEYIFRQGAQPMKDM